MTKRRKRRKKRIGISLLLLAAVFTLPALADKKKAAEPYFLVAGTVFQESGFALPNAEVVLVPDPPPDAPRTKIKKLETVSDSRGEFAFRVPTAAMRYIIKVRAKRFQSAEKPVTVEGQEGRLDVTFQLHEESR
jgi:Carboxypeptidase regulatory-like domain